MEQKLIVKNPKSYQQLQSGFQVWLQFFVRSLYLTYAKQYADGEPVISEKNNEESRF